MAGVLCCPPQPEMRALHQRQRQQQQHLVDFQGRTLCVSTPPSYNGGSTASAVLEAVFSSLGVSRSAAESLEVPWRLMCNGKFLAPDKEVPHLSVLRVWAGGLKGGKGGFGAMLRAMAKQVRQGIGYLEKGEYELVFCVCGVVYWCSGQALAVTAELESIEGLVE